MADPAVFYSVPFYDTVVEPLFGPDGEFLQAVRAWAVKGSVAR
jgi:hypothetical protein